MPVPSKFDLHIWVSTRRPGERNKSGGAEIVHGSTIYIFGTDDKASPMAKPDDPGLSISHDQRVQMGGA